MSRRPRETKGRGDQTLPGLEGAPALSSATLRILASMPSRTIGRSRGAIISQYYNRTVRLRRRSSRPLLGNVVPSARPSLRLYDLELDSTILEEDEKRSLLVKELQGLSAAQRDHMVRNMPLSLGEKRCLRMSHSFGESYRVGSTKGIHALTVFCSWDYKVTQKRASRVQQDSICTQLKELLAEWHLRKRPRSVCGQLRQVVVLGLGWLLCLGSTMGCTVAVLTFSEVMIQRPASGGQGVEALALPLVVSVLNLGASYLFRGLATLERHDSPVLEVYMAICRNLILKMAVLGVLCYHWLGRRVATLQGQCWEDFVGQELYRFMVVDFIFMLLDSLFGELVWRLGVLFSPLLPAVQILRLLFLFHIKKASLMANCQAPRRPWLASHMSTVFLTLLCFPSFLGAAVFLCYAVWQVRPSSTCGPFRTLNTMYEAGTVWVRRLEHAGSGASWLPWLHHFLVENTFFLFLASALLLAVIYFNIQVVKGQRKVICLLKEQIRNAWQNPGHY